MSLKLFRRAPIAARPVRTFLLLGLFLAGCTAFAARRTMPNAHDLIGTWRGVRYEVWDDRGRISTPFGDPISGYAVFDATGHAFIQMMRTPPVQRFAAPGAPTAAELEAAFSAFAAYYGPYTIDDRASTFTIQVEGSNMPAYTGSEQVRRFQIHGDTLKLGIAGEYQATLLRVR